jgi:hypothetical protein
METPMAKGPQTATLGQLLPQVLHNCGLLCGCEISLQNTAFSDMGRVLRAPEDAAMLAARDMQKRGTAAAWSTKSS